jgi:Tol biopolymer transport system component
MTLVPGHEVPIPAPPRPYLLPALPPDGTRVAVFANDQDLDIWLWDLGRSTLTPFTFAPGIDAVPVWTPDGRRLIFSSERAGVPNLFWQAADGTGAVERLNESPNIQYPSAVSPDGRRLIFTEDDTKTLNDDVMAIELDGTLRVTPLVQSPFRERNGIISPDGRWLTIRTPANVNRLNRPAVFSWSRLKRSSDSASTATKGRAASVARTPRYVEWIR